MFSLGLNPVLTLSALWKKIRIAEKEGDLPVLNFFFPPPIAKINARPTDKIAVEGLDLFLTKYTITVLLIYVVRMILSLCVYIMIIANNNNDSLISAM